MSSPHKSNHHKKTSYKSNRHKKHLRNSQSRFQYCSIGKSHLHENNRHRHHNKSFEVYLLCVLRNIAVRNPVLTLTVAQVFLVTIALVRGFLVMMDNMLARHRQIKLYMVLAILGFVAIIALSSYISWKHKVYIGYNVTRESEWIRASDSKTIHLKGTLLTYSNDGMSCTNLKGKTIWNQT